MHGRSHLSGPLTVTVSIAAGVLVALLAETAVAADPVDLTPPSGTLTVDDGSGYTNDPLVTLHVPATDDVGVVSIDVSVDSAAVATATPYVDTIQVSLVPEPSASAPDGQHTVTVTWRDAAGNAAFSGPVTVWLDREVPVISAVRLSSDPDEFDALLPVTVYAADAAPLVEARFSSDGSTWSPPLTWATIMDWQYLDPAQGGSPVIGPRTLFVQVRDAAGKWSATASEATLALPRAPIKVSPDVPVTGQTITLTPQYPAAVTYPTGTKCWWRVAWGNDRSLYYAHPDETFGGFDIYGPASGGFCKPLSFTMPWIPYRQVIVSHTVQIPGTDNTVNEWIGGSPDVPSIHPIVGSTDRHITWSNIPLVYVLPDDYVLVVGVPTTYRAFAVAGAKITSRDLWSVAYPNVPEMKLGGTTFTFTPKQAGNLVVSWGTDSTRSTRWSAHYDPPARYPDYSRPNTTAPLQRIGTGTVGTGVPVTITWTGTDRGWGIARYQLERSVDGGSWRRYLSANLKTFSQTLAVGHAYRYRVRAIDKYGNVGYWDYGLTFRPQIVNDTSAAIGYASTGGWSIVADPAARGGALHETEAAGARATFSFTGRDVAWISERGPGNGRAKVYVDGALVTTVDLTAATEEAARVVFRRHCSTAGAHVLRIVVEGTAGRPTVGVDGFLVLR